MPAEQLPDETALKRLLESLAAPAPDSGFDREPAAIALCSWSGAARALWIDAAGRSVEADATGCRPQRARLARDEQGWVRLVQRERAQRFDRRALERQPQTAARNLVACVLFGSGSSTLVLEFDTDRTTVALPLLEAACRALCAREHTATAVRRSPAELRLVGIGRTTAALVHDLGHVVTLAGLQLERAQAEAKKNPAAAPRAYGELSATLAEAHRLCARGLAGARRERSGDLRAVLEASAAEASQILGTDREVGVQLHCGHGLPAGRDAGALARVVRNLVLNAIEASPRGSEICIEAQRLDDERLEVWVRDGGRGIAASDIEALFTRAESGGAGSGCGTLSVLDALTALDGTIEVDSEPGRGTEICLRFRAAERQPAILVVDRHRVRREARCAELARQGRASRQAGDAEMGIVELDSADCQLVLVARGTLGPGLGKLCERARSQRIDIVWTSVRGATQRSPCGISTNAAARTEA